MRACGVSKVYLCPRFSGHRGDPNKCDYDCAVVRGERYEKPWKPGEFWVDEVYQRFMITTIKTVFGHNACMRG